MIDRRHFRDSHHYWLAVASEVVAPGLRLVARAASRAAAVPPHKWRTGLILGNGHIGDTLYRTCSLDLLKRGLPGCEWSYLTTPSAGAVLEGNPSLSEIMPWTTDGYEFVAGGLQDVKRREFDVALCSENVAHQRALSTALRLGIPNRVAFTRKGLSGLATMGVPLPQVMSHAAAFRSMVEYITDSHDTSPLRPRVFPSAVDKDAADAEWMRLNMNDAEFVIACSVTTRQTIGDCPPALFVAILRAALKIAPNARVLLSGLAEDRELLESLAHELGARAKVSAGTLSVLAFGALLARCTVFIGTDSGSRHLANAAGIPVFFVRNMGTTAAETGAYCPTETDIAPPGEYLSPAAMRLALGAVDRGAVASRLVAAARARALDKSEDMPR